MFRQLAQTVEELFLIQNSDFSQTIYVSPGYERIWQRSPEELYQNPAAWLESVYPADRERLSTEMQRVMFGENTKPSTAFFDHLGNYAGFQ
ncbi:MAG: PAS domain-containing protein, partial [Sphingomonadales bacterium]|nr:PAS domain-containing protein [Sphingomonadales bacterium]